MRSLSKPECRLHSVLAGVALAVTSTACGSETEEPSGGATGGQSSSSGGADGGAGAGEGGAAAGAATGGAPGTGNEGAACKVGEEIYPHGASNVPDPASCNTCQCDNGQLTGCTEIACPQSCPRNHDFGVQCAQCGPVDECEIVEHGCFEVCDEGTACRSGFCSGGVCVELCG